METREKAPPAAVGDDIAGKLPLLGGRLCLDFCNTAEYRDTDRPVEFLVSARAFARWAAHAGMVPKPETERLAKALATDADAMPSAIRLRESIYSVLTAHRLKRPVPSKA